MYFERSGLSKDKAALARLANEGAETNSSALVVRDPYVFEFFGLKAVDVMDEGSFESALLERLEEFLLELVDLKMEGFSYAHVGQMNMYLNWFKENVMCEGDNPPVGIVLCPRKDEDVVRYATGSISNEVFVSKYEAVLPDVSELEWFVFREVKVLRERGVEYQRSWE